MNILKFGSIRETAVIVTISKWGNSLGLRIPRGLAEDAGLKDGTPVDIRLEKGRIVVVPQREPTLEQLLSRITPENIHLDVFNASPLGKEIL